MPLFVLPTEEEKHRITCRNIEQSCESVIGTHSLETSMGRHYGRAAVRKRLIETGDSKINIIEVRQLGTGKICLHKDIGSILDIPQPDKLIYFIAWLYMERLRDSFRCLFALEDDHYRTRAIARQTHIVREAHQPCRKVLAYLRSTDNRAASAAPIKIAIIYQKLQRLTHRRTTYPICLSKLLLGGNALTFLIDTIFYLGQQIVADVFI